MSQGKSYEQTWPHETWRVTPPDKAAPSTPVWCRKTCCVALAVTDGLCDLHARQQETLRAAAQPYLDHRKRAARI